MDQITVKHADGSTFDLLSAQYRRYVKECVHIVENQQTDIVSVKVDAASKIEFSVGDIIIAGGQTYRLNTIPQIIKDGTRADGLMEYSCEFESVKYDLRYYTFLLPEGGSSDAYTGTLADWVRLLLWNANRATGSYTRAGSSAFMAGVKYYMKYAHTSDVYFASGKSYYVERDGVSGRVIELLSSSEYSTGGPVSVWEQNQGNSSDYDYARVMEPSDDYVQCEYGKDYTYGMNMPLNPEYYTMDETWVMGSIPVSERKYITKEYAGQNLLSVLQDLCKEYGYEYRITESSGVRTLNILEPSETDLELSFGRGNGLYRIQRDMIASTDIITRLYAYGSTDNLYPSYRYGRLCLPGKSKTESYIQGSVQISQYGMKEGTVTYDDIRPERVGSVTSVGQSGLTFSDTSMDFDLNAKWYDTDSDYEEWLKMRGMQDNQESRNAFHTAAQNRDSKYMITGTSPKIHFNSGNLAGYEFEVESYDDATKSFTVVRNEDGFPYSDSTHAGEISSGDEYVILDIYMPWTYIDDAERRLLAAANADYENFASPLAVYGVKLTRGWIQMYHHQTSDVVTAGNFVKLDDDDTDADDYIKIQSYRRNYLSEDEYEITLCNERRETYWERWWRRERRTLSKGVRAEDSVRSADGAAVGTGMLRTVDGGADSVSFSGGRIATGWGLSDVAPATWTLKEEGSHAVLIVPRSSGKSSIQIVPESSAAAVARTSGAVRIGTISARENGKRRTATVVGIRTNIIGNDVILTYGDTPISLDFKMSDVDENMLFIGQQMEALLQQIGSVASSVSALATRMQQAESDIALLKSIVIRPVTGVEFDVTVEDIDIPGQYSYAAHAVPADTSEQYVLHYDIYAIGASVTQSGSKKYLSYDVDGVTVVCMFNTDTGLLNVPQFVSEYGILQDTLFVNAIIDVGEETEKFTDMQQTYLHVHGQ